MTVEIRKPILVAGVGLTVGLWLWNSLHHSLVEIGEWATLGTIALGGGFWWYKQNQSHQQISELLLQPLQPEDIEKALAEVNQVNAIETEAPTLDIVDLKRKINQLPEQLKRQELQFVVTGGKNVGKTSLKQVLENQANEQKIDWVETKALLSDTELLEEEVRAIALAADLVFFVVAGDLTESQWQIVQQLVKSRQRVLLVFNKQDQYALEERIYIQQQIQQRVAKIIPSVDLVAIAAAPNPIKVRQQQEDGSTKEWLETQPPEITDLASRLSTILTDEKEQLIATTTWREAIQLKQQAKDILNQIRRDRSLPIIEQYQWIAAATAFANPLAALDLLATAAVNTQMLVDLSGIYQQKFSLSQAQNAGGILGKLMVQLGLVELSTNAIAGLLKTNAWTYVAGSAVQGVSAAYLTRIAGLSVIEYLQEQEVNLENANGINLEKLTNKLQQVFQQNQRTAFLQNFVKQTVNRLSGELSPSA
ncbi:MAG: DUF697 domain-containing protein [Stanieria sp.]